MKLVFVIALSLFISVWIASNAFISPDTIIKAMVK
jgi:hypothetical protein